MTTPPEPLSEYLLRQRRLRDEKEAALERENQDLHAEVRRIEARMLQAMAAFRDRCQKLRGAARALRGNRLKAELPTFPNV